MFYFIVTTCLFPETHPVRESQYRRCITRILDLINTHLDKTSVKVIIVEGNGQRDTYLDSFVSDLTSVIYTTNNLLKLVNKGHTELLDIVECIHRCRLQDNDFIVKLTGRYYIEDDSPLFNAIKANLVTNQYDCCIKYGSYQNTSDTPVRDCITGFIAMRTFFIKQIHTPKETECVEWLWASVSLDKINPQRVLPITGRMGLSLCPASNDYFSI